MIRSTWTIPALLAALMLVGLIVALTGDGWRDVISWAALAAPVCVAGWAMRLRHRH